MGHPNAMISAVLHGYDMRRGVTGPPGLWTASSAERYNLATVPITHAPWQSRRGAQPVSRQPAASPRTAAGPVVRRLRDKRRRFYEEGAS